MLPAQPTTLIPRPFANDGSAAVIPDTTTTVGRASFSAGFPTETQLPLREGGIAPNRLDFNGILKILSSFAFWEQSGGQWTFNTSLSYVPPSVVYYDGKLWWCLTANGPDTPAGVRTPGTAPGYWQDYATALQDMSGGGDTPIGNAGGTYNRRVVLRANQVWTSPVSGYIRVTCVGGGGAGGNSGRANRWAGDGGNAGGTTSFGTYLSAAGGPGGGGAPGSRNAGGTGMTGGGGGGAGAVSTAIIQVTQNQSISCVVGQGAGRTVGVNQAEEGVRGGSGAGPGGGGGGYWNDGGGGAAGAGNGTGRSGNSTGTGGPGGRNGTGYGGGGGGCAGYNSMSGVAGTAGVAMDGGEYGGPYHANDPSTQFGGGGGAGAIIIEYYLPETA